MNTITVTASRQYDVMVEGGLLDRAGSWIARTCKTAVAVIVSDDRVFPLYGARVKQSLEEAGFRVVEFVFPNGEASKNLETYGTLLNFLCEHRLTRTDLLVALGGGVVGDLTGFAAATYLRGISFVQIPTTLLAMVDSSVGGKTAVNLDGGKNQAGSFYQPAQVLCDPTALSTLPESEFLCGCAEVIKYAVIRSRPFFRDLNSAPIRQQLDHVITTCVEMKRDVVAQDEFDRGGRMLLNFGHTIGHAAEACSGFTILHGQGVAMGMAAISRAASHLGVCTPDTAQAIVTTLEDYGLPTRVPFGADELYEAALMDKKLTGSTLHLVVPKEIGRCTLLSIPVEELREWLRAAGIR